MRRKIRWSKFENPYKKSVENHDGDHVEVPKKILGYSPYGFIADDSANIDRLFNFWIGDTTFNVSKPVVLAIQKVEGVETLDVPTRYRFRVGIGRLFDEVKVKTEIEYTLACFQEQMKLSEKKQREFETALEVASRQPYFCVYILPNEKMFCRYGKDFGKIRDEYNLYNQSHEEVGGLLVTHENIHETNWKHHKQTV